MRTPFLFLFLLGAGCCHAGEWPQFRGPQAGGVDATAPAPVHWDVGTGENILWKTPIPGMAHASPIIWGNRIFVATAVAGNKAELKVGLYGDIASANDQGTQQWRLLAIDKSSGKVVWDKLGYQGVPRFKRHTKGSHCSSTPATDGWRIAAIFGSEGLFCFDMDGALVWKKDLGPLPSGYYLSPDAEWGYSSSPVIHNQKIVVLCDVLTNSFLAVYGLADGKELWRVSRDDVPTWGSPTVVQHAGQTQILINGWHHSAAYNFTSGEEAWKLDGGGDIPVPTPIAANGLGYFTSGHGRFRPMRAVRLNARGDITPPDPGKTNNAIAWAHARQGNYMQTPILVGTNLFGALDNGVMSCFDATSGAIRYSERLGDGAEGFTSSPVSDGRNIYFASELGRVYVVPAGAKFSVTATNQLKETCMASPALSAGTLFYRLRDELVAIGKGSR
jgi:outer membrane protein assembly factor BamB